MLSVSLCVDLALTACLLHALIFTISENIKWNEGDRVSYNEYYSVKDGLPLYPQGRTGLSGKGVLERWGPNYVSIPIITRYGYLTNFS